MAAPAVALLGLISYFPQSTSGSTHRVEIGIQLQIGAVAFQALPQMRQSMLAVLTPLQFRALRRRIRCQLAMSTLRSVDPARSTLTQSAILERLSLQLQIRHWQSELKPTHATS